MIWLTLLLLLLVVAAALAARAAARESKRAGLPTGALLYSDTGRPVGRVAGTEVGRDGKRQERPLVSEALELVGRPDYLIEAEGGVVPVEVKSTACPASGRPYDSHLAQLAAYCLLVEDVLGASVPYGLVKYRDREVRVEYTPEMRERALALIADMKEDMRAAAEGEEVHRSHDDPRRCAGCSVRDACTESLA
ncbi:MAG TPA: PD-(D/E)XK nuclease family protein [Pyrinomonadaceae bacterium]|nr:PD-(D/E)XK nuclease family protein [Pyrinomonadaceae bacterium]